MKDVWACPHKRAEFDLAPACPCQEDDCPGRFHRLFVSAFTRQNGMLVDYDPVQTAFREARAYQAARDRLVLLMESILGDGFLSAPNERLARELVGWSTKEED